MANGRYQLDRIETELRQSSGWLWEGIPRKDCLGEKTCPQNGQHCLMVIQQLSEEKQDGFCLPTFVSGC